MKMIKKKISSNQKIKINNTLHNQIMISKKIIINRLIKANSLRMKIIMMKTNSKKNKLIIRKSRMKHPIRQREIDKKKLLKNLRN